MKQRGFRYCSTCKQKLQKWGKTNAGTPRWRCPNCTSTGIRARPDLAQALLFERFVAWLLGKQSQEEIGIAARSWRKQTEWCWEIVPKPIPRTTNHVEGGINSQLRTKLKLHRGMTEDHQRWLVEWYLYSRTEDPKPTRNCR